ncbi:MAG: 30S ribosomal protein S6 [Candidatus Kerfeldbacteria bacterium]|nr:30S ribosomal protein S6 [Candidatus Kerfeldbacteria bacterium]
MIDHYELLYIIPGNKSDEEVAPLVEQAHALITSQGGTISKSEFWGKRKLAYDINHIHHGFYDLVHFDLESTKLPALERSLGLAEYILRHQVIVRHVLTPEQQAAADQLRERIAAKRQAAKEKEVGVTMAAEAATPTTESTEPAPKVTAEELDEKLEEILESNKIEV